MQNRKLSPREELLHLQKLLFERIQNDINDYLGKSSPALLRYKADYNRELQDYERLSNKAELLREVSKSDVVFCGDYHTLRQSQRTVIKILREIVMKERPVILGLEMVHHEDQASLDDYMAGKIHDQEFLHNIDYRATWNFEWQNYKQLFDFAKKYKIPVHGLNCHIKRGSTSLRKRDQIAAELIVKIKEANPNALLFVLYGDLHICSNHIPKLTAQLQQRRQTATSRMLSIFQNSENLYWLLSDRGMEQKVDVLKIDERSFCVMNTPPWVKFQTYLNWLEHRNGRQLDNVDELTDKDESYDYYHRLWDMADTIATFLNINKQELDEFNIFTSGDVEFLDFLNTYLKDKKNRNNLTAEMTRAELIYNGTCLMPGEGMIYVSTLSINKSAEKIAQFIHSKASKSEFCLGNGRQIEAIYYGRILFEAIGYIGSKIINYKRKCALLEDHRRMSKHARGKKVAGRMGEQRIISGVVVQHAGFEKEFLKSGKIPKNWARLYKQEPRILFGVTQALGQMLGERLFGAVIDNRIEKNRIRHLFMLPITTQTDNRQRYFEMIYSLRGVKGQFSSKSERF